MGVDYGNQCIEKSRDHRPFWRRKRREGKRENGRREGRIGK